MHIAFLRPPHQYFRQMQLNPIQKTRSKKFEQGSQLPQSALKASRYVEIGGNGKTNVSLRIAMWNVNGIRSILSKKAMRDLIVNYNPDFICVNQTKINEQLYSKEKIKIEGFKDYWNFCKCSAGYSGVAVFTKFIPISLFEDFENPIYSQQGRVLTLQYELFYLVVVYMPSVGPKKPGEKVQQRLHYKTSGYEVAFQKHCEQLKSKGKHVIIAGDMNVCHEEIDIHFTPNAHKQPGFTSEERASFKHFLDKGWVDTFRRLNPNKREYTWWKIEYGNRQKNIGKRLDYFIVNSSFMKAVTQSTILGQIKGSDHCPIFLEVDLRNLTTTTSTSTAKQQPQQIDLKTQLKTTTEASEVNKKNDEQQKPEQKSDKAETATSVEKKQQQSSVPSDS